MKSLPERIEALLERPGVSLVLIAEAAGVHRNTLDGYKDPTWNPKMQTFDKIASAVGRLERALP